MQRRAFTEECGANLGDTQKFGSGAVSGSGRVRYFVLPARAVFAMVSAEF